MEIDLFGIKFGTTESRLKHKGKFFTYELTKEELQEQLGLKGRITKITLSTTDRLKIVTVEK